MTDTYYRRCADVINQALGRDAVDAEMVADIERFAGRPLADMTFGEFQRAIKFGKQQAILETYGFGVN